MRDFRELLTGDGIHIFDGAIGTRLYDKGVYINRSYDELNLINKDLVREVHEEYIRAGAEITRRHDGAFDLALGAPGEL